MSRSAFNPLALLQQRNSSPKLTDPAPGNAEREQLWRAAMRAPDHGNLRPWRFLVIEGDRRAALGELFVKALLKRQPGATEEQLEKARLKPLRAPLLVVVIARISEHPKVPAIEQRLSAGCAAYGILLAAEALGYAGIWRTGDNAFDRVVYRGLGLSQNEEITGFLYIGTRDGRVKPLPEHSSRDFVQSWQGEC